ncbi:MAG: polyphenol oxidase family protein [Nitriliruptoraceae bacterium]
MPPGLFEVALAPGTHAWFTLRAAGGEQPAVGHADNMSPYRPHVVSQLAVDRRHVAERIGYPVSTWHHMRQVHGATVAVVDERWPIGAIADASDGIVTSMPNRPLVVHVADCVPVLLATREVIGAVHVGRRGLVAGVLDAALERLARHDAPLAACIGPSIRGCCYEVGHDLQAQVTADHPQARATTTWGTPALDLAAAVEARLDAWAADVTLVDACTHCDPARRWFSHRQDATSGRFAGIVVRTSDTDLRS